MDEVVDSVQKLLPACRSGEIEVEARIRRQLVNRHSVQQLIEAFDDWEITTYSERRKISKHNRKCTYRSRVFEDGTSETICKSSISKEDANDAWCAVHVSVEAPMPSMQRALDAVEPVSVTRYRRAVDGHYVDVTVSQSKIGSEASPSATTSQDVGLGSDFRVEVEASDVTNLVNMPHLMLDVVNTVCAVLQGNKICVGYYDWKTVAHLSSTSFGPFCIDRKNFQKPRTMTIDVLYQVSKNPEEWIVTPKVDGVRRFLLIFNGMVYSVGTAKDVTFECKTGREHDPCVLDCEFAHGTYYAFDMPVLHGEYCGSMNIEERLSEMDAVISDLHPLNVIPKPYESFSSFDGLAALYDSFSHPTSGQRSEPSLRFTAVPGCRCNVDTDGLIFYRKAGGYMQAVPKWKVHSTVDLSVTGDGKLMTCDGHEVEVKHAGLPEGSFGVWEFAFDRRSECLVAKRPRPDKPQANSAHIVEKNLYNSVPGTIFTGQGFYLMRKYHNRVKRWAITQARDVGATLFDVGTGQGGDLGKWKRASKVFCVEPDTQSLTEMLSRCDDTMLPKITTFNVYLFDVMVGNIDRKIDIFTAFFCMNQWSEHDWKALEKIITDRGSKKCRLLAIAMTSPREHKSNNLEIRMMNDGKYNIKMHGTRIMDIDEVTVRPERVKKKLEKCGMKMTTQDTLDTDDFMTPEERKLSSMYTLFTFHRTPNRKNSLNF